MNMKKIIAGIMAVCVIGGAMPSVMNADNAVITASIYSYNGTYDLLSYKGDGDYIYITGCDESATEIEIPAEIDGFPVKHIGDNAFYNCKNLISVTIPDSVNNIEIGAFSSCDNLKSINILGSSWRYSSENGVLFNGTKTELIKYPRGKTEEEYVIPDSVADIKNGAFSGCEHLTSVMIPEGVKTIGMSAFSSCENLKSIVIPNGVASIGDKAFDDCSALASVTIPDSVTRIGMAAFMSCSSLTSITIPDSVTNMGGNTFQYCINLKSVKLSNSLPYINGYAFSNCSSLTSITIPDCVKTIQPVAFSGSSLISVIIPDSVTKIDYIAFSDCQNLTSITILNPECEIYGASNTISNNYQYSSDVYYNGTIYGYTNSTAQAYADKYGYKFESIGEAPARELETGDINGDNKIDATDASFVIIEYSKLSTDGSGSFTEAMKKSADVNGDGKIDAVDSSIILGYYSYTSTGGTDTIEKYLESKK
ncbi:MAG: leucine-rich repeat protein [Ruminococcus flavefaciens]|nr:leucine-rich repeat protein [Ruminococcus flavefaciens]MCM1229416.1 leucine-rich repeat protein [Ruminococcus flavefaciens]